LTIKFTDEANNGLPKGLQCKHKRLAYAVAAAALFDFQSSLR
jgi:hypothetical protein